VCRGRTNARVEDLAITVLSRSKKAAALWPEGVVEVMLRLYGIGPAARRDDVRRFPGGCWAIHERPANRRHDSRVGGREARAVVIVRQPSRGPRVLGLPDR